MDLLQKTQKKVTTFAFAAAVAFAMALACGAMPAFAATVPWNSNVTVTAYVDDSTYDNAAPAVCCHEHRVNLKKRPKELFLWPYLSL